MIVALTVVGWLRSYFSAAHLLDTTSKQEPSITLCANKLQSADSIREALTHELIHAYDHCAARRDLTRCDELACSEIRAAREAECRDGFYNALGDLLCKGVLKADAHDAEQPNPVCAKLKTACASHYATLSVRAVFPSEGKQCVAKAMRTCFADLAPEPGDSHRT